MSDLLVGYYFSVKLFLSNCDLKTKLLVFCVKLREE
jgi:hypothetical protein